MSYGLQTPCYNCVKRDEGCKDAQHIQEGINMAHQDQEGHKGSGMVMITCGKCVAKT